MKDNIFNRNNNSSNPSNTITHSNIICRRQTIIDLITDQPVGALVFYCDNPKDIYTEFTAMQMYITPEKAKEMQEKNSTTLMESEFNRTSIRDQLAASADDEKWEKSKEYLPQIEPDPYKVPFCTIEITFIENSLISKMRILRKDSSVFAECNLYNVRGEKDIPALQIDKNILPETQIEFTRKEFFDIDLTKPDTFPNMPLKDGESMFYGTSVHFINFQYKYVCADLINF